MTQNKSPGQIFLEEIQRDFYKDRSLWLQEFKTRKKWQIERLKKNPFCIYSKEDLSKLSPEGLEFYKTKMKSQLDMKYTEPPTDYEDPATYNIIMDLSRDIKSVTPKNIRDSSIQFGTLPAGPVQALHIIVPNSTEHLIIFESELFYFCNMISKIVATACPISNITYKPTANGTKKKFVHYSFNLEAVKKNLQRNHVVLRRFRNIILGYLIYDSVAKAPAYIVPEEYFRLHLLFRTGMELFVLGHEYGHILSGHLDKGEYIDKNIAGHKVTEIGYEQSMELLADAVGTKLMMDAMYENYRIGICTSYANAQLFLHALSILEEAAEIIKNVRSIDDGIHPPLKLRRAALRAFMETYGEVFQPSLDYASKVESVVEFLWNEIKSDLSIYYAAKADVGSPFSNWRYF